MLMTRFFSWLLVALTLGGMVVASTDTVPMPQPQGASPRPRPPAINPREAAIFAEQIQRAAEQIAREYVQEVKPEKLAAHAIVALYMATETPLPEGLRGDPANLFSGKDIGEELRQARITLGNPAVISFQYRRDVKLSIQAMLSSLDPYSMYLSVDDTLRYSQRGLGSVGLLLEERDPGSPCVVQNVILGGPAEQAGIRPGDELLAIDGKFVARDRSARLVAQDVDGPGESTVELLIRPFMEASPLSLKVVRSFVREETVLGHRRLSQDTQTTWDHLLGTKEKIALLRLGSITGYGETRDESPSTPEQMMQILGSLQQNGLTGLVLDLRDCPGGSMQGAMDIANLFIPEGKVLASTRYRSRDLEPPFKTRRMENGLYRTPMVVLVGPNTMGGGELIAAALQDHDRAIIVGQRTRGKASIQQTITLDRTMANHQVRLTTGYFLRPKGGNLNRFTDSKPSDEWGVQPDPDFEVRLPPHMLRQARRWRQELDLGQTEVPAGVPQSRLENDPVLYAGVQALLKKK